MGINGSFTGYKTLTIKSIDIFRRILRGHMNSLRTVFLLFVFGFSVAFSQESSVRSEDALLADAFSNGDSDYINEILHPEFTWIDAEGIMWPRRESLAAELKPLLTGEEQVTIVEHYYGAATFLERSKDDSFTMYIWDSTSGAPKLLNITEIQVKEKDYQSQSADFEIPCYNPCTVMPWVPLSENQRSAYAAWQDQEQAYLDPETGRLNRDGWIRRINNDQDQRPVNTYMGKSPPKEDRVAFYMPRINAALESRGTGFTVPVLWSRWWDIGDEAVFNIMLQPTFGDKAYWASRIFSPVNGVWMMSESYHTYIETSPIMISVDPAISGDDREDLRNVDLSTR